MAGLGLASEGLAIKMVGMQVLMVNALMFIVARIWNWPFDWSFQPLVLGGCVGVGWLVGRTALTVLPAEWNLAVKMVLGLVPYVLALIGLVAALPSTLGVTRQEMVDLLRIGRRKSTTPPER